ncbi:MAG: hypothetical protein HC908_15160 [Calothrix sp. SM1_7_51]|nr:hypothetical protein [Calothrix sp. SM1_7_51]
MNVVYYLPKRAAPFYFLNLISVGVGSLRLRLNLNYLEACRTKLYFSVYLARFKYDSYTAQQTTKINHK